MQQYMMTIASDWWVLSSARWISYSAVDVTQVDHPGEN